MCVEKEKSLNSQTNLKREREGMLLLLTEESTDSEAGQQRDQCQTFVEAEIQQMINVAQQPMAKE